MTNKPNILLFFTDDQRFDTIGVLGNDRIQTPNLDELVAAGTSFTRAHIPGGTCGAVCMPSRAMLHTGRTLFHIDREGQDVPESHTTMGECFKGAGYATFGTGKWHNGTGAYARSFTCGDEIFFGGMFDHWNVPACRFDPTGRYDKLAMATRNPWLSNQTISHRCDHISPGKHSTELFVEAAGDFVRDHDKSQPFFMYVSLMAPHDPRTMPREFLEMYPPADVDLPENFLAEHPIDTGALRIRDELLAEFPRNPDEIKRHIAEYYAMISHLDAGFGRLIAALRETGVFDDTIIVFAGDNGLAVGQHGLMGKQSLYEHSVRVPLIMAGPGVPQGQRTDALVYLLDILPTLCDLTGVEIPSSVEGHSLRPCLDDIGLPLRDTLYLAYGNSIRGVTDGSHKLIEYACGASQLFDLSQDAIEVNNLLDTGGEEGRAKEMREKLVALAEEWDDAKHPTGEAFWAARHDVAGSR